MTDEPTTNLTWSDLDLTDALHGAIKALNWEKPTPIQAVSIPIPDNKDVIALAETGSGKTAAFVLPMLRSLLKDPHPFFGLIIAPTRELALQIGDTIRALGGPLSVRQAVLVGGVDQMAQALALSKNPHIVVATPGRLKDHLETTKGFDLRHTKYFVLDEADRLLDSSFEDELHTIIKALSPQRRTMLFSATMTRKVVKLQRASFTQEVERVEVSRRGTTVKTLTQSFVFCPAKYKDAYLCLLLIKFNCNSGIIFAATCTSVQRLALLLRNLGYSAIPIHGHLSQTERLGALNRFKSGNQSLLIATDVASRGLDIPSVDLVINYDVPLSPKDYVHRVGRTARAGRSGVAVSLVTQYDIEQFQKIESFVGGEDENYKMDQVNIDKEEALVLVERVSEAARLAAIQMKEEEGGKGRRSGSSGGKMKRKR
ncbi:hypothetical protein RCL1_005896 [Eukaryota sp. TZLM3-RCL]